MIAYESEIEHDRVELQLILRFDLRLNAPFGFGKKRTDEPIFDLVPKSFLGKEYRVLLALG